MASLTPPTALNGVVSPLANPDFGGVLAVAASATEVDANNLPLVSTIDNCLIDLAKAVVDMRASSDTQKESETKIYEFLLKPFDELGTMLTDLVLPDADDVDVSNAAGATADIGKQIVESIRNPFYSVMQSQAATLESSVDQIKKILFTGTEDQSGFVDDYLDKTRTALKSLFLGDSSDGSFVAVYAYAFEHGIQAVDTEIQLLRRMRKLIAELNEESSKLPTIIDFKLPNHGIVEKLCEAEYILRENSRKLRTQSVFDRPGFARATGLVCSSKDLILDGKFDFDLLKAHSKNLLGLSQYKDKDLADLRLLPNVDFKLKLQELDAAGEFFLTQERNVTTLWTNIVHASDDIKKLADLHLGDLLALLNDVLTRQIGAVRRELQVFGAGFDTATALDRRAKGITAANTTPTDTYDAATKQFADFDPYKLPNEGIRIDLETYVTSQLSAYLVLEVLCAFMRRIPSLYSSIDRILRFETAALRLILDMANRFNVENCGEPTSGYQVGEALKNYLRAADMRLRQDVPRDSIQLNKAGQKLKLAIDTRLKFLECMRSNLFFGNEKIANIFSAVANGRALLSNISSLASKSKDTLEAAKSLDFKRLLGLDNTAYSPADVMLKALQCLANNCDNPMLSKLNRDAQEVLDQDRERERAKNFDMSELDRIPSVSAKARSNRRLQQVVRILGSVQGILNLNTNQLCNSIRADKERERNVRRASSSRAVFGDTPVSSVRPSNVAVGNTGPSAGAAQVADALVVQTTLFPSNQAPKPTAFENSDSSFQRRD